MRCKLPSVTPKPKLEAYSAQPQQCQLLIPYYQTLESTEDYSSALSYELKKKLKELETVMLGPDLHTLEIGDLKQLLMASALAVSNYDTSMARWLMSELRQLVSVSGEPIQRLGAYMLEGLVARLSASGSSIFKSKEPAAYYTHMLHEVCPCYKFGYMSANGAIAEAMKHEDRVHIIDFRIGQGSQWIPLIQAFAGRPGGPPNIRMTGIDDFTSPLNMVGRRLSKLAERCKVPFVFHACGVENLGVRPGEALAVNLAFILHRMPDESVSTENHRDRLLRMVKILRPKVVTLVEHQINTNTAAFYPGFLEALEYYTAMFESIDASVEQHCLARDVVNIIACEGRERVERQEPFGKWRSRFKMAGFTPYPLSSLVNATIKTLLNDYCNKFSVEERDGALFLGWLNRDLVVSCAWN